MKFLSLVLYSSIIFLFFGCKKDKIAEEPIEELRVSTYAGSGIPGEIDGLANESRFISPVGITTDASGNVYVAGGYTNIRKIDKSGLVTSYAGNGLMGYVNGITSNAEFYQPDLVTADESGNLYVTERYVIRKITVAGIVSTFAGVPGSKGYRDGTGVQALFGLISAIKTDKNQNVYVADDTKIRKITTDGTVSTIVSDNTANISDFVLDDSGNIFFTTYHSIYKLNPYGQTTFLAGNVTTGFADGFGANAKFNSITGIAIDSKGLLYVVDRGNACIRKIRTDGTVTTVAGARKNGYNDGLASEAKFNSPIGIAIDKQDNIYISDTFNNRVRKISKSKGTENPALPTTPQIAEINMNCNTFANALINNDRVSIKNQINSFFKSRKPSSTFYDNLMGYSDHIATWINQINACSTVKITGDYKTGLQGNTQTGTLKLEVNNAGTIIKYSVILFYIGGNTYNGADMVLYCLVKE